MNHAVPPSSFTTGMLDIEEHTFTWTIENFSIIRHFKSMIDAQKIYFPAGGKIGSPSKWRVRLQETTIDDKKWIGIYFTIEEPSKSDPTWKNAYVEMGFANKQSFSSIDLRTGPKEVAALPSGLGFNKFISGEETLERLVIKLNFKLYYIPSKPIEPSQPKFDEKDASSPEVLCKILSGISSVPGDRAPVFPLPPKKSRWTFLRPFKGLFGKNKMGELRKF